jgi:hypothetical protein
MESSARASVFSYMLYFVIRLQGLALCSSGSAVRNRWRGRGGLEGKAKLVVKQSLGK